MNVSKILIDSIESSGNIENFCKIFLITKSIYEILEDARKSQISIINFYSLKIFKILENIKNYATF